VSLWLGLSLLFALLCGLLVVGGPLRNSLVVQDDARQHVFWMRRFLDPELFPGDLLADYFQSVAPVGYTALYWSLATLGLDPLLASKLLPLPIALVTSLFSFLAFLRIFPIPAAAFVATLLLNLALWSKDDVVSATPRAFLAPCFLLFLYCLVQRAFWRCQLALALLGLFYPQGVFVSVGMLGLGLVQWADRRPRLSRDRGDYLFFLGGIVTALLVLVPFASNTAEYGPTITAAQARNELEFLPGGRVVFFRDDPWEFWVTADRSGLLPRPPAPTLLWIGCLLPAIVLWKSQFPLVEQLAAGVRSLPQLLLASVGMFVLAHALLFRLHYPSRYTGFSFRVLLSFATAVVLLVVLDALFRWATRGAVRQSRWRQVLVLGSTAVIGLGLITYPMLIGLRGERFGFSNFVTGRIPPLYEFLLRQPKDAVTASISGQADYLPTFAQRPIVVGPEYGIPLHVGYYRQLRERAEDLLRAQYSPDASEVKAVIEKYHVRFWLLERTSFTREYLLGSDWLRQFRPSMEAAVARLDRGETPALSQVARRCTVLATPSYVVLDARCIVRRL
jgi:hypothetical protein